MQRNVKIILIAVWTLGLSVGGVMAGVWWYHRPSASPSAITFPDAQAHHLDTLFDAPAFQLTDEENKAFSSKQLTGKIWVADFVFTTCSSLCPMMSEQMHHFQEATAGTGIEMISFSVDPEHDTPAALKDYAGINRADLTRWHFLTGDKETLWNISNSMKLAVGPGDDHQIMHSSHFLLVDRQGHVRGIYDYNTPGFMTALVADATALTKTQP